RPLVERGLPGPRAAPVLHTHPVPPVPGLAPAAPGRIEAPSRDQGVMLTRLGRRTYHDAVDRRTDPYGRPYYWIGGPPGELRGRVGDDTWAVGEGLASVTSLTLDLTHPDPRTADRLLTQVRGLRRVHPEAYPEPDAAKDP
ncbi:MAG: hypothetical protein AB1Z98_03670, partial [Nannocystaceae bacterium]